AGLGVVGNDVAVAVGVPEGGESVGVGIGQPFHGVGQSVGVAVGVEVVGLPVGVGVDGALHGVVDAVVIAVDRGGAGAGQVPGVAHQDHRRHQRQQLRATSDHQRSPPQRCDHK